jgi:hypothetical protein
MLCAPVEIGTGFGGRYWWDKETAMTVSDADGAPTRGERLGRISADWWATIVAGVVVLLAVAGLLPKIPW